MARGSGRQTEVNTQRGGDRQKDKDKEEREREIALQTLILKDSRIRSIWTYLTASSCYANANKHGYAAETGRQTNRQTDRRTNKQTARQGHTHTHTHTHRKAGGGERETSPSPLPPHTQRETDRHAERLRLLFKNQVNKQTNEKDLRYQVP